jgi:hypothetical protein
VKAHRVVRCLDNQLTDGGEVVSLTHWLPFTLQEDSWYSFLLEANWPQGHSASGRIRSIEKSNDIGTRIRDLLACGIVPRLCYRMSHQQPLPSNNSNTYQSEDRARKAFINNTQTSVQTYFILMAVQYNLNYTKVYSNSVEPLRWPREAKTCNTI